VRRDGFSLLKPDLHGLPIDPLLEVTLPEKTVLFGWAPERGQS
jgi:hypothetical protein